MDSCYEDANWQRPTYHVTVESMTRKGDNITNGRVEQRMRGMSLRAMWATMLEPVPPNMHDTSINQSKRKTSNANGQTNLGHKHKAPDHNHEATQPMVDLPHTS